MLLSPGSMLERYEIVRVVGRGGMGEVYHATDTRLRRPVALKILRQDKDQSAETGTGGVARLLREARAAAALNHPHSVAVYELGEADGVAYIAMELVTGESFRRHARSTTASVEMKLGWLVDAARALWAAHKAGILHRDIKPSNIMVSEEGIVKVLDFGLAKPFTPQAIGDPGFQTVLGQVLGTPRYMAPELLEGASPDARTDQFAFGLTAYELLCGEYAGGPLATSARPLHEVSAAIPLELGRVVGRMLARRPEDRFASMEEVAHTLRGCLRAVQGHAQNATASACADDERTMRQHGVRHVHHDPGLPIVAESTLRMQTPNATLLHSRPPTHGTVPLAQPLGIPLPPPPVPAPMTGRDAAAAHAPSMPPRWSAQPGIASGAFPAGSSPPPTASERNATAVPALHPSTPPARGVWVWVLALVGVGAVALVLGVILALRLR